MIADLTLRWIVTALFALSAAECVYAVAVGRRTPMFGVGQALHFVMAVAMAVMAWPRGAELPTVAPMIFFLLAAAWFVAAAVIDPDHWAANFYHALMMLAMTWMYAAMNGRVLPGHGGSVTSGGGHHGHGGMPGMDLPANPPPEPPYIGGVNWLWTVGFALAAGWWLWRFVAEHRAGRTAPAYAHLGTLGQAMMAAAMAIMFAVML